MAKRGTTSKYRGVSRPKSVSGAACTIRRKEDNPWTAALTLTGKIIWRSNHATEREAALAYDRKVLELGLDRPLNILKPAK